MPTLDIDTLIKAATEDEIKADAYSIADSVELNTTAWQKLSPLRSVLAIVARIFSGFSTIQALINRSHYLDYAEGVWLTLLALYVYGVEREEATTATGQVTIDNTGGGLYTYDPGDLVLLNSTTKKTYVNTARVVINPLQTGLAVEVMAQEAGFASTASPGQINAFVAASPLLSVTNAAAIVGENEETDPDLRDRCRDAQGALSPNGAAAAFRYLAKTKKLNGGVDVSRALVLPPLGNGTIRVVVASPSGTVPGTTSDATTDLGKLFLALNQLCVTAGYTLLLSSATTVTVTPDATIYVDSASGLTSPAAHDAALEALTDYVANLAIGGIDFGSGGVVPFRSLEGVMRSSATGIVEAKLASETNTALTTTQVAVLGTPTLTVVFV